MSQRNDEDMDDICSINDDVSNDLSIINVMIMAMTFSAMIVTNWSAHNSATVWRSLRFNSLT